MQIAIIITFYNNNGFKSEKFSNRRFEVRFIIVEFHIYRFSLILP